MKKEIIRSKKIGGSYSSTSVHGTAAGGFLFVTGQVANPPNSEPSKNPVGHVELGTVEEQTVRVMENLKAILEEAGTSFEHVVKRNVYMTHVGDFNKIYEIMGRYFPGPVASTGVLAGLVPPSARVEVEVIAIIPGAK